MLLLQHLPQTKHSSMIDHEPNNGGNHKVPTPEEIAACCREIRRGWSEAEHRRRAGVGTGRLQLAVRPCRVALPDIKDREFFS